MTLTLRQLADKYRHLADMAAAAARVQAEMCEAAVNGVRDGMTAGVRPDGSPQTPLKKLPRRSGNPGPPLIDYGKLKASVSAEVVGTSLILRMTGPGARRHQRERQPLGVSKVTARKLAALLMQGVLRGVKH